MIKSIKLKGKDGNLETINLDGKSFVSIEEIEFQENSRSYVVIPGRGLKEPPK